MSEEIVLHNNPVALTKDIDDLMTKYLTEKTTGEIVMRHENSYNIREFVVTDLILSAIQERDVEIIESIIKRIDGGIPKADEREKYANIIGNAIDMVLEMPVSEQADVHANETAIVSIAKALILASLEKPGGNFAKKRDRKKAAEIILQRCGGSKFEPTKLTDVVEIVEPDWAVDKEE